MRNAKVVYCIDGFNGVEIPICSINELLSVLQKIKSEASTVMEIIFSADVVVEGSGRLSVGLSQQRELNSQIITGQAKLGEIVEKVLQSMPSSPNPTTQPSQEDTAHADA